ncbi:AI-2E family transporter [Arthrobacter caoxuetaonis]|uniref:AI-2E family transporter n=1 Tax=Arthrobacter caoxuetaonis TaxID=2886935 RepID=A0A9X1MEJ7_9MICC|nr:AI-2E family transporter [Arthrobacter caoxuetaonis]MCC3297319.1 AI-2E family transporter [Arthrobacter caoxuetaonis]USQ58133.1 AI-2E family transporter [Arthrobacter caoxuetaonis]
MRPHARRVAAPKAVQAAAVRSSRAGDDVPYALRVSASWAWRLGVVLLVSGGLVWILGHFSLLIIPLMIAALIAGLLAPISSWLRRNKVPSGLAVAVTIVSFLGLIVAALTLVGRQLALGFRDLWDELLNGFTQFQDWLESGPLQVTSTQIDELLKEATSALQNNSASILSGAVSVGSSAGHFAAGVLLTLFALVFFLLDGRRIWRFVAGLMPRRAKAAAYGAGIRGWESMTNYVRVQLVVAFIDAVGIGAGAAIIGVPLALPLSVLVFLGSFIPLIGAVITGSIAVLLALVANGWLNAVIMLGIVLLIQQVESHILQPLIMGRAVSLHPLAVILAVTGGTLVAGIAGALFAVPLMAIVNSMVRYIAARRWEQDPLLTPDNLFGPPGAPPQDEEPDDEQEESEPAARRDDETRSTESKKPSASSESTAREQENQP